MTPVAYYNENWTLTPAAYEEARRKESADAFADMKPAYPAPEWEPLTPAVLERLHQEPPRTQYWLAHKGARIPVRGQTIRVGAEVCFDVGSGATVSYSNEVTHIMRFVVPEVPT